MANWRFNGVSAQSAVAGRPWRSRHKPPMTPGVSRRERYWVREDWVPLAIGLKKPVSDYLSLTNKFERHSVEFSVFGAPSGYSVLYICPEGYMARVDLHASLSVAIPAQKVSIAIVPSGRMGQPTPASSYIVKEAIFYYDRPMFLRNIMLGPGDEIRIANEATGGIFWELTGIIRLTDGS